MTIGAPPPAIVRVAPRRHRALGLLAAACLVALPVAAGGCSGDKKGALMLAVNTDMKAPKDVNAVSITISADGQILHSSIGKVTPQGDVVFPATLAIAEGETPGRSVRIRVMAFQDRKPRVLRDVRTSIPRGGRVALLRLPLAFASDGSAQGAELPPGVVPGSGASQSAGEFDFFNSFQPTCSDPIEQTVIDGECASNVVDSDKLPDFEAGAVLPGTDPAACFDVARCLAGAKPLGQGATDGAAPTLQREGCRVTLNGTSTAQLNFALVTPDTGECVKDGECYVPIDRGPGGWREEGGAVVLPPFVCTLATKKNLRLVYATGACAPKSEAAALCLQAPAGPPGLTCAGLGTREGGVSPDLGGSPQSQVAVQAILDAESSTKASQDQLTIACRAIAADLGADATSIANAEAQAAPDDKTKALCALAVSAIGAAKAKAGGSFQSTVSQGSYDLPIDEKAACQGRCVGGGACDPKANPFVCTGGKLFVSCAGSCSPEAGFPSITCDPCASTCQGACNGDQCSASCNPPAGGFVLCDGRCAGEITPQSCRAGKLEGGCKVEARCDASCDVSVAAKATTPTPVVTVTVNGASDATTAQALKSTLETQLPVVYHVVRTTQALAPVLGVLGTSASFLTDIKPACIPVAAKSAAESATRAQTLLQSGSSVSAASGGG